MEAHTTRNKSKTELTWLDSKLSTRDPVWQQCTQHHKPYQNPPRVHFNTWLYVIGHVHHSNRHVDFPKISEKTIYLPVPVIFHTTPAPLQKQKQPKKQNKTKQRKANLSREVTISFTLSRECDLHPTGLSLFPNSNWNL